MQVCIYIEGSIILNSVGETSKLLSDIHRMIILNEPYLLPSVKHVGKGNYDSLRVFCW